MVLTKVGVTGASGMVGRHVLASLARDGIVAVASSRTPPQAPPPGTSWNAWDLAQWKTPEELDRIFPEIDAVMHVGASVPAPGAHSVAASAALDANTRACLCIGEWAQSRNLPVVFLSGSVVYADPDRAGILESDRLGGGGVGGFYGLTKLLAEQILSFLALNGLRLCIIRPSSIFGFGLSRGKLITDFLISASEGKTLELSPPADDCVNLIHAADVADAMLEALRAESWGIYNVAAPAAVSIREIAQACVGAAGAGNVVSSKQQVDRDARVRFGLCSDKARQAFGFRAKVNLEEGIDRMWTEMKMSLGCGRG
jgi:UDP-glucose 4-epimerase